MEEPQEIYKSLQKKIEQSVAREMRTPRDFDYLSARILAITNLYLSSITLKRFWGYLGDKNFKKPRLITLNILAQVAGYANWGCFYKEFYDESGTQSAFINNRTLCTNQLPINAVVELWWEPNRQVTIIHKGYEVFEVQKSINSKLSVGDTFRCGLIVENEPMYLQGLMHGEATYNSYVCGRESGVKFEVVAKQ